MGYMRHHAIIVSSWDCEAMRRAHDKAEDIFGRDRFEPGMRPADFSRMVTPVAEAPINGYRSFAILPDGSKEGWADSDDGDARRDEMIEWLRAQADEDGGNRFDYVEVQFGDDGGEAAVVHSGDDDHAAFIEAHPDIYGVAAP